MIQATRWPLTLSIALALAAPAVAQQGIAPAADVTVNMRDVDIADVAQQVSRLTGRTIILDPAVKGTVNVTSARPLSPAGVWDLFVSVLRGQGYAVVRNGRAWRVIPQANAAREPSSTPAGSGRVVTRTIRLRNLSPEAAARIFKPLVAAFGSVEPITNPNAVVVTDYADNIARIAALARSLDGGGDGTGSGTITLRYAAAKDVAAAIQGTLGESGGPGGGGGGGDAGAGPRAVADERSNIVIVRGNARAVAEARAIARTLDRPSGTAPVTRVFRLKNNDAEAVTAILQGLMSGEGAANNPVARTLQRSSNRIGTGASRGRGLNTSGGLATLSGTPALQTADGLSSMGSGGSGITGATGIVSDAGGAGSGAAGFATPELAVQPAPELNAIVVRGSPSAVAGLAPLIAELDVRRPQVMIEAAIVEITGDRSEQLGIQLGLGAAADGVSNSAGTSFSDLGLSLRQVLGLVGSPAAATTATDGLTGDFGSAGDFRILIQALARSTRANLLSTPSITTLDNEPAEIVVGQNVPFRTGSYATDGNTTTPFTTIERADVGITLRVVPRVHEGDTIRLEVSQEVSSLVGAVAGAADLITNRRSIQTTVLADDGQTIVLGGLISDDQIRTRSQVPVLGDIPVVGNLFKSRQEAKTRRTLFVFLKPTILRNSASVAAASAVKYDRVHNAETQLQDEPSLLLEPPRPRLPSEIDGIY